MDSYASFIEKRHGEVLYHSITDAHTVQADDSEYYRKAETFDMVAVAKANWRKEMVMICRCSNSDI
jgi:hypothetical protein